MFYRTRTLSGLPLSTGVSSGRKSPVEGLLGQALVRFHEVQPLATPASIPPLGQNSLSL